MFLNQIRKEINPCLNVLVKRESEKGLFCLIIKKHPELSPDAYIS